MLGETGCVCSVNLSNPGAIPHNVSAGCKVVNLGHKYRPATTVAAAFCCFSGFHWVLYGNPINLKHVCMCLYVHTETRVYMSQCTYRNTCVYVPLTILACKRDTLFDHVCLNSC